MDKYNRKIEISTLIQKFGQGSIDDVKLKDFSAIELWTGPISGKLRARTLSALVNAYSSVDLISSCAQSIGDLKDWRDVLVDFLKSTEISPATIEVARHVLRRHCPTHPLADLDQAPAQASAIYDAIGDGEILTFIIDDAPTIRNHWIFIDIENPIDFAAKAVVTGEGSRISVRLADLGWIDRDRAASPAFAAVSG